MQYVMALRAKLHRRKRGALTMGDLKRLANGESGEIKEESEPADEEPSSGQESQPKAPPKRARFKVKKRRP